MILKFHAKHFERATLNALPVFAVSKYVSIIKEVIRYDKSEALYDTTWVQDMQPQNLF